jgi:tetratricopeptide (TPR) repeat protein
MIRTMIPVVAIRVLLTLGLAWQSMSPEASQHWNAAQRAEQQKQFDAAVQEYRQVTKLEPAYAGGFVSLGQAYMEQHDFGSALAPLKHALELDPSLAPAHQLLGYALLAQGYAAEAIPHLDCAGRDGPVRRSDSESAGGAAEEAE